MWSLPLDEAVQLKVDDCVDFADATGRFWPSRVLGKDESRLRLFYKPKVGRQCTVWCDYEKELHRFAPYQTVTVTSFCAEKRQYVIGDFVDVYPRNDPGWKVGRIVEKDRAQWRVEYSPIANAGSVKFWWVHKDDESAIARLGRYTKERYGQQLTLWMKVRRRIKAMKCWYWEKATDIYGYRLKKELAADIVHNADAKQLKQIDAVLDRKRMTQTRIDDYFPVKQQSMKTRKSRQPTIDSYFEIQNQIKMRDRDGNDDEKKESENDSEIDENDHENVDIEQESGDEAESVEAEAEDALATIPKDCLTHICSYLDRPSLKQLKRTSYENCKIVLDELSKTVALNVFNTNQLLDARRVHYVDFKGFSPDSTVYRFRRGVQWGSVRHHWQNMYSIPHQQQLLVAQVAQPGIGRYLFDKRNLVALGAMKNDAQIMSSSEYAGIWHKVVANKLFKLIVVKWFDSVNNNMEIIQFLYNQTQLVPVDRLLSYVENEFIATTDYQVNWYRKISEKVQKMKKSNSTKPLFCAHFEADKYGSIDSVLDPAATYVTNTVSILIIQFNPEHPALSESSSFRKYYFGWDSTDEESESESDEDEYDSSY